MFLRRPLTDADVVAARRALLDIAYRGPDSQGEWSDATGGVFFGHRRLSIIDLSHASDQPMQRSGQVFMFNGELYNFKDLRRELEQRGVRFESNGDCEVFLRSIEHWKNGIFDRVDGMFAFVHWDGRRGLMAVDPFGEKPLFLAATQDGVYVCSEIKPLVGMLGLSARPTEEDWAAYLSLGFLPPPRTFYQEIMKLPPGTWIEVVNGNLAPLHNYWSPPHARVGRGFPRPISEHELDGLVEMLIESLERRLIADVPLTLFLSAGIDSTLVAALCRRELGRKIHGLTIAFRREEGIRDESSAAARIAAFLDVEHQVIKSDRNRGEIERLVGITGQPSGTVGALSLDQISGNARGLGFKVALTGMGGDEVTAGYAKHAYVWRLRHLWRTPQWLRATISKGLRVAGKRALQISTLVSATTPEIYLAVKNYPALDWLRLLPGFDTLLSREFAGGDAPELAIPRYELARVMPAVHLLIADHASMRYGLELRTPFLSRRLVELIAQWDPRALIAFGQKSILRRIVARYLPSALTNHAKAGFSFPRGVLLVGSPPQGLPCLDNGLVKKCWNRRHEGGGWSSIAVRIRTAENFFESFA